MMNPAVIFRLGRGLAVAPQSGRRALAAGQTRQQRRPPSRGTSPVRRTLFHAPSFSAGVVMGAIVVLGAAYLPEMMGGPARAPVAAGAAETGPRLTFEFDHLLRTSEVAADPEPYASAPRVRRNQLPEVAATPAAPDGQPGLLGLPADPQPLPSGDAARPGADLAVAPASTTAPASTLAPAAVPAPAFVQEPPPAPTPAPLPAVTPDVTPEAETFLLQAASFRSREDADRLRASLLLLDLPASTTISSLPSGVWYRVTVGPFTDRRQAEQALSRLHENNISAIWTRS